MDMVATHQRSLIGAALRTTGKILELGCGAYSTLLLHEIGETQKRHVTTLDNNIQWLAQFMCLESAYHHLELVGWWGDAYEKMARERWGLVFVDQGQPIEREYAVRKLLDCVDVFILHDVEEAFAYGYSRTLPMFRYNYTDRWQKAWTAVVSNVVDVSQWFIDLPPCEPSKEIT